MVLVATRNALNIGAAARAMSNFGFRCLRVVRPFEPSFREAKSAVGAADLLKASQQFSTVADAVKDCVLVVGTTAVRDRAIHHPLKRLEEGARLIQKKLQSSPPKKSGRVALLFGSEKTGLSNDDLSHCNFLIRIATQQANISMNLGQAVAVCLYELSRDPARKTSAASKKTETASAADVERITQRLLEVMQASGYLTRRPIADVELRMRRMVRRMQMPARDTEVWLGILRQIIWKLQGADRPLMK